MDTIDIITKFYQRNFLTTTKQNIYLATFVISKLIQQNHQVFIFVDIESFVLYV